MPGAFSPDTRKSRQKPSLGPESLLVDASREAWLGKRPLGLLLLPGLSCSAARLPLPAPARAAAHLALATALAAAGIRSFSPDNQNVIEFYRPLTLIVGHNGAGKTVRAGAGTLRWPAVAFCPCGAWLAGRICSAAWPALLHALPSLRTAAT